MLNHELESFLTTGRARDVPFTFLSNWMASRLFTKMSAGEIFDAVENYAAKMGYTKAEAQEIRSGLNPKMITSTVASIQGRTVVRKLSKHLPIQHSYTHITHAHHTFTGDYPAQENYAIHRQARRGRRCVPVRTQTDTQD